ncbi:MAG: DNA polymerase Y family protein, partial [Propionibacteriaceae bacterium]
EARRDGVRRGMRRRDATARCPDLVLTDHSPERDVRAFEAVLSAVEQVSATVTPIRPGLCALTVPRRFYGGETEAAAVVAEHLVAAGVWDCRAGIADGMFTAEQAAKQAAPQDSVVVPVGGSRRFLSRLPVAVLDDLEQVSLFRRLGLRTLGDLAALPVRDVATRFGASGAWLHRLARGADARPAVRRVLNAIGSIVSSPGAKLTCASSSPGTAWCAGRCASRSAASAAGSAPGCGRTPAGSARPTSSTGSTGSSRATRPPSRWRRCG